MRLTTILAIMAIFAALVAAVVAALSRHKKAGAGDIKLIGQIATVEAPLAPEGTIIVHGELWRAKSDNGSVVLSHAQVRVVGFKDFLALVERCD
ncbi:MAG TPA: NfeD family protein [Pyrinomonadaceae bacterium]|jgi:membrane-bound serine protease (ClpP class)